MNKKSRSSLVGVTGGYLVYLAWQLFRDKDLPETTMAPWLTILFAVLFALGGAGLMVFALRLWKQALKEEDEQRDENAVK